MPGHFLNPFIAGPGVGAEDFEVAFPIVVKQGAMEAEGGGVGRVNEAGRIAGTHLKEHAQGEFT